MTIAHVLLPSGGLLIAVLVAWIWRTDDALEMGGIPAAVDGGSWILLVRWLAPVLTALIMLQGLLSI